MTPDRTRTNNRTSDQVNIDRANEKFSLTLRQDYGDTRPKTVFTSQHPTSMRDKAVYSKLHHPLTKDKSNINNNFEKDIDLSEHVFERLKRMEDLMMVGKVVTVGPVIMLYQLHCL